MASQAAAAKRTNADVGLMDSASAAAAETMASQAAVDANSDIGIMDASGRPATTDSSAKFVPPERAGPTRR
jgi:hypothetical protein